MGHKEDVERFLARAKSGAAAAAVAPISTADPASESAPWGLPALRGRLVELSARGASAVVTAAFELVREAQRAEEPVAWVMFASGTFYPPDVADGGIDLAALVIVRVDSVRAALRAAERLVRSGGFGLVVIDLEDLAEGEARVPMAKQGHLVTLARAHDAAIVCLTDKPEQAPSLGSLVSLHATALRVYAPDGALAVTVRARKDKQRGPGWEQASATRYAAAVRRGSKRDTR